MSASGQRESPPVGAGPDHGWRARRVATAVVFGVNGLLSAMWVSHIPVVSENTGVDHTELGGFLLILGGCAFLGMQLCGPIIDRWGPRAPILTAAVVLAVATLGPVFAHSAWQLACALALFGFANGAIDVSMNAHAVMVERAYGRPIMSAFHAYFSLGGVIGAGIAAVALSVDAPVPVTVLIVAVVSTVAVSVVRRSLLSGSATGARTPADADGLQHPQIPSRRFPPGLRARIAVMAAVAFALMLAEGTAYDWSALHLVERFGTTDAAGAVAFGAFSATMLVGRFAADTVVGRFGPVAVVRGGACVAAAGMTLVIVAPTPAVAVVGWAIFGIGVAGGVPQLFTAAGNVTERPSGRIISTVVGSGYLGMLAGPAVIGFVSHRTTLGTALWLAAAAMIFGALAAGVVRGGRAGGSRREGGRATDGIRARLNT